jgi:hypothetical protein
VERIHDSSWSICCGLRLRGPLPCKRPVPKPCDDRAGCLWKGIGARYSCGSVSFAPKRNPRSGAWRKYGAGAFRHIAGSSGDTRNTGDVGIRFEIALKDEIALKEMIQTSSIDIGAGKSALTGSQTKTLFAMDRYERCARLRLNSAIEAFDEERGGVAGGGAAGQSLQVNGRAGSERI